MKKIILSSFLFISFAFSMQKDFNPERFFEDFQKNSPQIKKQLPKKINEDISIVNLDLYSKTIIMDYEIYSNYPLESIDKVKKTQKSFV